MEGGLKVVSIRLSGSLCRDQLPSLFSSVIGSFYPPERFSLSRQEQVSMLLLRFPSFYPPERFSLSRQLQKAPECP